MVRRDTAIRNSEQRLSPVIGRMKADGTAEISSASQEKAKQKKSKQHNGSDSRQSLVRIEGMAESEEARHHKRRWPESDSRGKRVLQVSAIQEFFEQSHHEEGDCPFGERIENCLPKESKAGNAESVEEEHREQSSADRQKASSVFAQDEDDDDSAKKPVN